MVISGGFLPLALMQLTAQQIADLIDGTVEGNPAVVITGPAKIEEGTPGTITFLANPKYTEYLYSTAASAVLVASDFAADRPVVPTLIRVGDVYGAVGKLLARFEQANAATREISERASIHPSATLGHNVSIGAFAVVEAGATVADGAVLYPQTYVGRNAVVGTDSLLYPGVRIGHDCEVGERCILHGNVVIGGDGFGFAQQDDKSYQKVPQIGKVILEADVEIGANTTIDRATMGATIIRRRAKLDNLVMIAHNVEVGSDTVIAAQAGIAGSTKIGERVRIGGQAGFVGHIQVADGTMIQAQSGVAAALTEPDKAVYGSPAIPYADYLRAYAVFKKLPALYRRINKLEKELARLRPTTDEST